MSTRTGAGEADGSSDRALLAAARAGDPDARHHRAAAHLRDLLTACRVLPEVDRMLLDIEAWLHRHLEALGEHPPQRLLHQFGHPTTRKTRSRRANPRRPATTRHRIPTTRPGCAWACRCSTCCCASTYWGNQNYHV